MKRIAGTVVAFLLLLSMSGAAHSKEGGAAYVGGLKTWTNSWNRQVPGSASMQSNSIMLVGWGAEVLFSNRVFLGISYLMSFQDYIFDQTPPASQRERTDVDVELGKQFYPSMGCFFGFRSTQIRERGTQFKETVSGPFVGVRGAVPLINAVSLFGRLTYLPLSDRATYTTTTSHERATGWFAAAGIKYDFTKRINGSLGYQYETSKGEKSKIKDTFAGLTFDVMYVF
jgi:hypothetical protein